MPHRVFSELLCRTWVSCGPEYGKKVCYRNMAKKCAALTAPDQADKILSLYLFLQHGLCYNAVWIMIPSLTVERNRISAKPCNHWLCGDSSFQKMLYGTVTSEIFSALCLTPLDGNADGPVSCLSSQPARLALCCPHTKP